MSEPVQTAVVRVRSAEAELELSIEIPVRPARLVHMLPLFNQVADALTEAGRRAAEAEGRTITCRAGCGACCRQMVPISRVEGAAIRDLVAAMPEPRQSEIRARFAEARRRYNESGLRARTDAARAGTFEDRQAVGLEYLRMDVPCPFLENESCSIHPVRPAACREYLVTSPAEYCGNPAPGQIKSVRVRPRVSNALYRFDRDAATPGPVWIPLIDSLEVGAVPAEEVVRPGPHWLNDLLNFMGGTDRPPPDVPGMTTG